MRGRKETQRGIVARFLAPFLLVVALLPPLIAVLLVPSFHKIAVKHRETMLRDLVDTVWEVADYHKKLADKGEISEKEAQRRVLSIVRKLRYGSENRDYFWIIDTQGVTLAHPYRHDLEGCPGIDMADADGKKFLVEFIKTATSDGIGTVKYKWQWYGDPKRVEKKIAAVRYFASWGWVIGTGAYVDDIDSEMSALARRALIAGSIVFIVLVGLSVSILGQARAIERERRSAFLKLASTEEKLRMLLESIPDMIIRIRSDGVVLDFKDPLDFKPFFNPGEVLHNKIEDVWPEEAAEKTMETLKKAFESGKPESVVFKVPSGKRGVRGVAIEAQFVAGADDEALAVFRDVTKRASSKSKRATGRK
jgi:PAS domain S-box-containing protein